MDYGVWCLVYVVGCKMSRGQNFGRRYNVVVVDGCCRGWVKWLVLLIVVLSWGIRLLGWVERLLGVAGVLLDVRSGLLGVRDWRSGVLEV